MGQTIFVKMVFSNILRLSNQKLGGGFCVGVQDIHYLQSEPLILNETFSYVICCGLHQNRMFLFNLRGLNNKVYN